MNTLKLFLSLVILFMSAGLTLAQPNTGAGSGIEGIITISPIGPGPAKKDMPISAPYANATFVVQDQAGIAVTSFTTDDAGRFRISLSPGHYKVSRKGEKPVIGHFGPFDADVVAGKMTQVEWECDPGTR